ncbi:MAG: trypsin-like peptidase domain-containing protein, partial [Pseudomonadota bacterium]
MQDRTLTSVQIKALRRFDDSNVVGEAWASGFFWRHNGKRYLITNWHNATGRNPHRGTYIGSFAPSHFEVSYATCSRTNPESTQVRHHNAELSLYKNHDFTWLQHPKGSTVDAIAIEFPELDDELQTVYLNDMDFENSWQPKPGDECFIVGYPEGLSGPLRTPIHKRASVASEPAASKMAAEPILVDTLGNPGLSGSPVFARGSGIFNPGFKEGLQPDTIFGTWETFLGMYSGRIGDLGLGLQLGRVVSREDIQKIFE